MATVEEQQADLVRAVAEAKERRRNEVHVPKPQTRYVVRLGREQSMEQLEEWAAIDEYEESGRAWTDRLAARAQAKRDGLVSDTHYNGRPGIDRRLFGP
jgi:hypothetical protein